jgi:hypothetical protein
MNEAPHDWLLVHVARGWRSLAKYLLGCSERGLKLPPDFMSEIEQANENMQEALKRQREPKRAPGPG